MISTIYEHRITLNFNINDAYSSLDSNRGHIVIQVFNASPNQMTLRQLEDGIYKIVGVFPSYQLTESIGISWREYDPSDEPGDEFIRSIVPMFLKKEGDIVKLKSLSFLERRGTTYYTDEFFMTWYNHDEILCRQEQAILHDYCVWFGSDNVTEFEGSLYKHSVQITNRHYLTEEGHMYVDVLSTSATPFDHNSIPIGSYPVYLPNIDDAVIHYGDSSSGAGYPIYGEFFTAQDSSKIFTVKNVGEFEYDWTAIWTYTYHKINEPSYEILASDQEEGDFWAISDNVTQYGG